MDKTFYCKVCKRLIKLDECNACPNKELNIKQTKVANLINFITFLL